MEYRRREDAALENSANALRTAAEERTAPEKTFDEIKAGMDADGEMKAVEMKAIEETDWKEEGWEDDFQRRKGSQIYIGIPNGIVLCADQGAEHKLRGRFYHAYRREPVFFENAVQCVLEMEKFFDSINFPYPSTNIRSFREKRNVIHHIEKKERVMKDEELLTRHGDLGSFIIRVQQRQNSSMQGRLTWVEKNKTVYFRSVWEMIRLIDSAIGPGRPDIEEELPSWEE